MTRAVWRNSAVKVSHCSAYLSLRLARNSSKDTLSRRTKSAFPNSKLSCSAIMRFVFIKTKQNKKTHNNSSATNFSQIGGAAEHSTAQWTQLRKVTRRRKLNYNLLSVSKFITEIHLLFTPFLTIKRRKQIALVISCFPKSSVNRGLSLDHFGRLVAVVLCLCCPC